MGDGSETLEIRLEIKRPTIGITASRCDLRHVVQGFNTHARVKEACGCVSKSVPHGAEIHQFRLPLSKTPCRK